MWTPIRLIQFFQLSRHVSLVFYAFLLPTLGFLKGDIGSFELLQLLAFTLSFFWISGLIQGLMQIYPNLTDIEKKNLIQIAFWLFFTITIFFVAIIYLGLYLRVTSFQFLGQISFFHIFLGYMVLNTPAQILEYVLFLDSNKWLKTFCLFSFPIQIIFFSIPLILFHSLTMGVSGLFLWALVRFLFFIFQYVKRPLFIPLKLIIHWIKYAVPLVFSSLVGGLSTVINAALVQHYFNGNMAIFAIYRYGARELPFVNGLFEGLGIGIIPALVSDIKTGLLTLRGNTLNLIHLVFPPAILMTLFVHYWFPLIFTNQFQDSIPIFKIFLLLVSLRIIPTNPVLNALGKSNQLAIIGLSELVIHVCCSMIGLRLFGLTGMAFATVIAHLFEKTAGLLILGRQHHISVNDIIPVRWWLFYTLLLVGSYFISG